MEMDNRQKIIEHASELFRTYGIRAVTMDMLAGSMGISKRTIYEVFHDKNDLLQGVLRWMGCRQKEMMKNVMDNSENVIEATFKMLDNMRKHFHNMSPAFQLDMRKYHVDLIRRMGDAKELPYYRNNVDYIRRGIDEGVFRDDIDVEIINKTLFEVIKMSSDRELFPPDDFNGDEVFRNTYLTFLRGISTRKGLDLIEYYEKNYQLIKE